MDTNAREVFERNPEWTGREERFRLRPYEWEFFLWLDGRRTVREIGEQLRLDPAEAAHVAARLRECGLAHVAEMGLDEFYQRFADPVALPPPAPAVIPGDGVPSSRRLSFSLRRGQPAPGGGNGAANHAPLPEPSRPAPRGLTPAPTAAPAPSGNEPAGPTGGGEEAEELHLKPLMSFIVQQSGGGTVGQLAAYRVFLKVPHHLLRQAGIRSLNLVDTDFTIRDPALCQALRRAVEEVMGRPYAPMAQREAV